MRNSFAETVDGFSKFGRQRTSEAAFLKFFERSFLYNGVPAKQRDRIYDGSGKLELLGLYRNAGRRDDLLWSGAVAVAEGRISV